MKRLFLAVLACLMLWGCSAGPVLRAGYYIYDGELENDMLLHFRFHEDGTGYLSMLGSEAGLTWTPEGAVLGIAAEEVRFTPTDDGMEWDGERFVFVGDSLPDGYFPEPPAPGVYAVSSVSRDGDLEFHGTLDRSSGYLELLEDGTGTLAFDDTEYPFTLEGPTACFDGWELMLLDMSSQDTGGEPMVMVYILDGPIEADSIAFRLLEGENENE